MEISETRQGAVTVLKPAGPLCMGDAEQFRTVIGEVMPRCLGRVVVDVSLVAFVDSKGLDALVAATEELQAGGRALRLSGAGETLREAMDITNTAERFEFYEDVNAAVRSFLA